MKEEKKSQSEPIQAISFMVEVISKPKCEKQFIVRAPDSMGMLIVCCGSLEEFNEFFNAL